MEICIQETNMPLIKNMTLSEFFIKQKQEKTELVDGRQPLTDKGTDHDFIDSYYNQLFTPLKDQQFSLLEIGIQEGYSMDLWREYFTKAKLYAIDLTWQTTVNRVNTFTNSKAYLCNGYDMFALSLFEDESLDFIIEDGPHTLHSQIFAAQYWTKKLKPGGKLIIEDIQNPKSDCISIMHSIHNDSRLSAQVFDFREHKNRWDDVLIEITKK